MLNILAWHEFDTNWVCFGLGNGLGLRFVNVVVLWEERCWCCLSLKNVMGHNFIASKLTNTSISSLNFNASAKFVAEFYEIAI